MLILLTNLLLLLIVLLLLRLLALYYRLPISLLVAIIFLPWMAAILQGPLLTRRIPFLLEKRLLLRLLLERLVILVDFLLALEQIEESVRASNKVRMVSVDMCILNLDQVHDHLCGRSEALVKDALHDIADLVLQLLIPVQLRQVNFVHDVSQFLVHFMGTVERGVQQSGYLLSH